ncbi:hypothetical protein J3R83DRAFT_7524 [Lanmaoa asiatica]|nr:hypothetical protein J3R83DRAFT_7524 [Lanmaoa asiatica]
MDDSMRSLEGVLAEKPMDIVALLGKVCSFSRSSLLKVTGFRNAGSHSLCKPELSSSSQIIPASPPTKPVVRSRCSNSYQPLCPNNGSRGRRKGRMAKNFENGTWFPVKFCYNHDAEFHVMSRLPFCLALDFPNQALLLRY